MNYHFWLVVPAYLIGGLPTSFLVGRLLYRVDLRQAGSGNLGSTNVFRVLGAAPAVLVLAVDIFKGFAPVFWLPVLSGQREAVLLKVILGLAAIAGHIFSPYVRFRGGKGVATCAGVLLAVCPEALGLSLLVWVSLMVLFRIVSVASLAAGFCLPFFVYLTLDRSLSGYAVIQYFSIALALVVILTHRSNIGRLLRGEEKRLSRGGRPVS